jgi:hypothetical protein
MAKAHIKMLGATFLYVASAYLTTGQTSDHKPDLGRVREEIRHDIACHEED